MRMCLRMTMDTEAGNRLIKDGMMPKIMQNLTKEIKPEASYFMADGGKRTALFFFNMTDSSQMPSMLEPAFMELKACCELIPVMNAEELKTGLENWKKHT